MKRCFRCLCEKPLEAFYKHDMMADFAAKVAAHAAAHEREECARVCEARGDWIGVEEARDCAAAIRARPGGEG